MEFEPRDRAAYIPDADALVCADLHVGRDATSNVEVRLGEHEDLTDRFAALLERYRPDEAVLAGDLLHSFDRLPTGAAETLQRLQNTADAVGCRVVVTPGNHDTMLETLWDGERSSFHRLRGTGVVVAHGHDELEVDGDVDTYVVGHDHPVIEIEGARRPCYLYGTSQHDGCDVLMLPSFSRLPAGVAVNDMTSRDFQSPFVRNADALRPIVRDEGGDTTHEFPPLGEFRRHL